MNNDEAKERYTQAVKLFQEMKFDKALDIFNELDSARPNSRHVMQHQALCLVRLNKLDDAQEVCGKLEGKLEPDKLQEIRDKIAAARGSDAAAADSLGGEGGENVFVIDQVFPASTTESTVTGTVKSGVFHEGDSLTIVSPTGMPLVAPVLRIGKADTPLKIVRAGTSTVMLLQVEPHHVAPGTSATCVTQEESYAATMVVGSEGGGAAQAVVHLPELLEVERMVKTGKFQEAQDRLTAHIGENPSSGGGHRLLARVYLEGGSSIADPKKALEHIRKAYELGGADDPSVVNVLAAALAANGEADHGLRFIERLHGSAQEPAARQALAKHIYEFRNNNNLGHVWEFSDDYGEVVFESSDINEVLKALSNKTVPTSAKCRRDHVGDWRNADELLSQEHPDIAKLYSKGAKGGGGSKTVPIIIGVVVLLAIAVVAFVMMNK